MSRQPFRKFFFPFAVIGTYSDVPSVECIFQHYVRVLCVRMCARCTNNLLYARNISMPVRDECILCVCVCVEPGKTVSRAF
jgi:hypothetical protein